MTTPDDLGRDLARAFDSDSGHLRRLRERLVDSAQAEGVLDVTYDVVETPVGRLLLAATDVGMVRVAYAGEDHELVLRTLAERISPRILRSGQRVDPVRRQLDEYFAGHRHTFDVPLDWRLTRGFRQVVLRHLAEIAYGRTASYAAVARMAGNPRAVRSVGTACATNPLPVLVPCHRVIRSDGAIGAYLGGAGAKRTLLALEAA